MTLERLPMTRLFRALALATLVLAPGQAATKESTPILPATPALAPATNSEIPAPGSQTRTEQPNSSALHRCIGADGASIFTERACRDIEATDAPPPATDNLPSAVIVRVRSCARSQDDLLLGVRTALEAHDPNKLAEYYHWTGMGNSEGYRLMDRLTSFSERPLLDVQLVSSAQVGTPMPRLPPPPPLVDEFSLDDESGPGSEPAPPEPQPRAHADLLRVDQMRSETDYESQVTYFRLRSNAGCWWLQF